MYLLKSCLILIKFNIIITFLLQSPLRANKVISMDHRMLNLGSTDGAKETRLHDRRGVHKTSSNPLSGRPPLPPKRGSGSGGSHLLTSPMRSVSLDFSDSGAGASNQKLRDSKTTSSLAEQHHGLRFSSPNRDMMQSSHSSPSPTRIDIDTMGIVGATTPPTIQDKVQPPKPSVKGLTLTGMYRFISVVTSLSLVAWLCD